jgi:hypothetical protein
MPKTAKGYADRDNTILDSLAEVANGEDEMKLLLERLWATIGEMAEAIRKWHIYLLDRYIPANKVKERGGYYLPNAIGKNLFLGDLKLDHPYLRLVDVSKVAAHILQGLEAAVVLSFIGEQDPAACVINSCDHDGFTVSAGEPSLALWDDLTARFGLAGLRLEEKEL